MTVTAASRTSGSSASCAMAGMPKYQVSAAFSGSSAMRRRIIRRRPRGAGSSRAGPRQGRHRRRRRTRLASRPRSCSPVTIRDREVGPAVGDAELAEVDMTAPAAVVEDQRVRCAGVAVADHQLVGGRRCGQSTPGRLGQGGQPAGHRPAVWARLDRQPVVHRAQPGADRPHRRSGSAIQRGSTAERPGRPAVCSHAGAVPANTEHTGTVKYGAAQRSLAASRCRSTSG